MLDKPLFHCSYHDYNLDGKGGQGEGLLEKRREGYEELFRDGRKVELVRGIVGRLEVVCEL